MEDPFFVVKDEVQKTIITSDVLFQRWCDLSNVGGSDSCREEFDWTTNELRNCLRSIEWDLEDLEETITIVEKNPRRFKIDSAELNGRRLFVQQTRNSVKSVRDRMSSPKSKSKSFHSNTPLMHSTSSVNNGPDKPQNKYTRLENEPDSTEQLILTNHSRAVEESNGVNPSVLTLHDNSPQPTIDHDEQSMLVSHNSPQPTIDHDEQSMLVSMLGGDIHQLETAEATVRVKNVFKRAFRLLHIERDWKQWTAITILLLIVAIVIILFFLL